MSAPELPSSRSSNRRLEAQLRQMLAHSVGIHILNILPQHARYAVGHLEEFHFALILRAPGLGGAGPYSDERKSSIGTGIFKRRAPAR